MPSSNDNYLGYYAVGADIISHQDKKVDNQQPNTANIIPASIAGNYYQGNRYRHGPCSCLSEKNIKSY